MGVMRFQQRVNCASKEKKYFAVQLFWFQSQSFVILNGRRRRAQKKEDLASVLLIINTTNTNTSKNVDKYRLEFKTSNDDKTRITLGLEYSLQIFEKEQNEKSGFANILAYKQSTLYLRGVWQIFQFANMLDCKYSSLLLISQFANI